MRNPYFVIAKSTNGQWYFTLKAANGETIATSEMYSSLQACKNGIDSVKKCSKDTEIAYQPYHPPSG